MIGTLKRNLPYNSFLLIIFGLLLNWSLFTHPVSIAVPSNDALLYRYMMAFFSSTGTAAAVIETGFFMILLFVQTLTLNKLVNDQKMFSKAHYVTGMGFLLTFALVGFQYELTASFVVNVVLILILSMLCSLSNLQNPKTKLFNIGLLLGIATLIYAPSIFFIFVVLVAMSISRPFRLTEWIIVFLGLLTPYYFIASFNFLYDVSNAKLFPSVIAFHVPLMQFTKLQIAGILLLAIIAMIGIYFIQNNMRRLLVQSRNCWSLIYLYLMFALMLPFLHRQSNFFDWELSLVPIATILGAFFFYSNNKFVNGILFWGLIILSFLLHM